MPDNSSKTKIAFPKGGGIKIISDASKATVNDTLYIVPKDLYVADVIVRTKSGATRKVISIPTPPTTGNYILKSVDGEVSWVTE